MKQFHFKAQIKSYPEGPNKISKHIFANDEVDAHNKFRAIYDRPETIDWKEINLNSVEEIKH